MTTVVRAVRDGPVLVVTLDGTPVRNALDFSTWEALEQSLDEAGSDEGIRAVVLTGAGQAFSSGADLRTSSARGAGVWAPTARLRTAHRVLRRVHELTIPVVAAVEGAAVGIAWGLVLACDLTIASTDAYFAAPFLARGLIPDGGVGWFLPRLVGAQRAYAMLMLGERLGSSEALGMGLVRRVVEAGQALPAAMETARQLVQAPPLAASLARHLLRRAPDLSYAAYLDEELHMATLHYTTDEPTHGRAAFLQRRAAPAELQRGDVPSPSGE